MGYGSVNEKHQAHELIERLSAVVGPLEALLDPVSRAIANASINDEQETDQERQDVAESKEWFERRGGEGIPHEEVLADFGFASDNLKKQKE
jgi:hypothetical protein